MSPPDDTPAPFPIPTQAALDTDQELSVEFRAALWQERLEKLDEIDLAAMALKPVYTLRHIP